MKKETVNTFGKGLAQDLNELDTPNKNMVDCLNGTLVTYNGNELHLQNDMGNAQVGTSYLSKGYVPVGMKEYGGVIYVASYNPETKKGQIGSFPSPQQLYGDDESAFTKFTFNIGKFLEFVDTTPVIEQEIVKTPIFQQHDDATNIDTYREFHQGDKFIIVSDVITDGNLIKAIDDGIIKFRLAVVSNGGKIEYIDEDNLKLYDNNGSTKKKLWIYQDNSKETIASSIAENTNKIQIFNSKNSGKLMIIVEFSTIDTFNLSREYSLESDSDKLKVTFSGISTGQAVNDQNKNQIVSYSNGKYSNPIDKISYYQPEEGNSTQDYSIAPVTEYGVLKRLMKSGTINYDNVRNGTGQFSSWNYFVGDNTLTINWSNDYYNLNDKSKIDYLVFTFIPLNYIDSNSDLDAATVKSKIESYDINTFKIKKDSYNGDFEDVFPLSDTGIMKNYIYVCRIDRKYVGNESISKGIHYEYVYTGTFFNDKSAEDIKTYKSNRPEVIFDLDVSSSQKSTIGKTTPCISYTGTTYNAVDEYSYADFTRTSNNLSADSMADLSSYQFYTRETRNYTVETTVNTNLSSTALVGTTSYKKSSFVGNLSTNLGKLISLIDSSKYTSSKETPKFNNDSSNYSKINNSQNSLVITSEPEVGDNTITTKFTAKLDRYAYSPNGGILKTTANLERLVPVYDTNEATTNQYKTLSFKYDSSGQLKCISGKYNEMFINSIITGAPHTDGTYMGTSMGSGIDNTALNTCMNNMGGGTVGIMAGCKGDDGSFRVDNGANRGGNHYAWNDLAVWQGNSNDQNLDYLYFDNGKGGEIDDGDNFLMGVWKRSDGDYALINMATKKQFNTTRKRIDLMLKCILSQLLIARNVSVDIKYVAPDSNGFVCNSQYDSVFDIIFNRNKELPELNFKLNQNDNKTIEELIALLNKSVTISCYLPTFKCNVSSSYTIPVNVGSDFSIYEDVITYYTNTYTYPKVGGIDTTLTAYQKSHIFLGIVTKINDDGVCQLKGDVYNGYQVHGETNGDTNHWDGRRIYYWNDTGDGADGKFPNDNTLGVEQINAKYTKIACPINTFFTTKIAADGQQGSKIDPSYYNEMLINANSNGGITQTTHWTNQGTFLGPNICFFIHFGTYFCTMGTIVKPIKNDNLKDIILYNSPSLSEYFNK